MSSEEPRARDSPINVSAENRLRELLRARALRKEREKEEQQMQSVYSPRIKRVYKGHRNSRTMVSVMYYLKSMSNTDWCLLSRHFMYSSNCCGKYFSDFGWTVERNSLWWTQSTLNLCVCIVLLTVQYPEFRQSLCHCHVQTFQQWCSNCGHL